jgi:hypothetical protein
MQTSLMFTKKRLLMIFGESLADAVFALIFLLQGKIYWMLS